MKNNTKEKLVAGAIVLVLFIFNMILYHYDCINPEVFSAGVAESVLLTFLLIVDYFLVRAIRKNK